MLKNNEKDSPGRFLYLLKLSIISFVCMGVLIGYHGHPIINSLIGAFWFAFVITAGLVMHAAFTARAMESSRIVSDEVVYLDSKNAHPRRRIGDRNRNENQPVIF